MLVSIRKHLSTAQWPELKKLYAHKFKYNFEAAEMSQNLYPFGPRHREEIITAVSVGFFLILIGAIFIATPTLYGALRTFFSPDSWINVNVRNSNVFIPVPVNPSAHSEVYKAAFEFCLIWGLFQIFVLIFRFVVGSSPRRKARTVSSTVFWLGASYLISAYLNSLTATNHHQRDTWYTFWAAIIVLIGVALIVRAIVRLTMR